MWSLPKKHTWEILSVLFVITFNDTFNDSHNGAAKPPELQSTRSPRDSTVTSLHREVPNDPWMPRSATPPAEVSAHCGPWVRDGLVSVQVNVDEDGCNIPGDAANEPSIAVDTSNPNNIVIGWRQFDSVLSNFRQAGYGYSHDGGQTWAFPGVLNPGVFGSDPVLAAGLHGAIFYYSIDSSSQGTLFASFDGGETWPQALQVYGGDKPWMALDRTAGIGRGNIYITWASGGFSRSVDGGLTFPGTLSLPEHPQYGTIAVGPNGEVLVSGGRLEVVKSRNAADPEAAPVFTYMGDAYLGGGVVNGGGPNPGGLLGQNWIAYDHSMRTSRGYVYVLASVRATTGDPLDVMFTRSVNGGTLWSVPVRVNDDPRDDNAWQWFGTMSVAPNGRIDAVWNDTRNDPAAKFSELYYSFSLDAGRTWSPNVAVSLPFNHSLGYPRQGKIGDYYHMLSDDLGASVAYAATFNGEQDVYFLRLAPDCNENGVADFEDILSGTSEDVNNDAIPEECERDIDEDEIPDAFDSDIDNDGVPNEIDHCPFGPVGAPVFGTGLFPPAYLGSPIGDRNGNCMIDLSDYRAIAGCLESGGPGVNPGPCAPYYDLDHDFDMDLKDFAGYQVSFGRGPE